MDRIDELLKSVLNKAKSDTDFSHVEKSPCPSEEDIACYLDSLLSDNETIKVEYHLAECSDCLKQTVLLRSLRKEIQKNGYMAVPTEATERAKEIIPESSVKSFINVISEFIGNAIMARKGYRLVSYGSIALIVMLSVGVYSVMLTEKPIVPTPSPYGTLNMRGDGTSTQLGDLTGEVATVIPLMVQEEVEISPELSKPDFTVEREMNEVVQTPVINKVDEGESVDFNSHTVEAGDTLRSLAEKYYDDPGEWIRIYEANKDTIEDKGSLKEGQILIIPRQ